MKRTIILTYLIMTMCACTAKIGIESIVMDEPESIPQGGTTLTLSCKYARTKFRHPSNTQMFKYRMLIDGVQNSLELLPCAVHEASSLSFNVSVPSNDSYETRRIQIEYSIGGFGMDGRYYGNDYTEWDILYTGIQTGLAHGVERSFPDIEDKDMVITIGSDTIVVKLGKNGTCDSLRRLIYKNSVDCILTPTQAPIQHYGTKSVRLGISGYRLWPSFPPNHYEAFDYISADYDLYYCGGGLLFCKHDGMDNYCKTYIGHPIQGKELISSLESNVACTVSLAQ